MQGNNLRRARRALEELVKRSAEGLVLYDPMPVQEAFHKSQAQKRMVIGSNRSGKTQASAADCAWDLMGIHPYRPCPKQNMTYYAVGWDHEHIKQVMWKKLARPGAFKIIRDEHTRKWRTVLPNQEYDWAYSEKWRDAAPFLPERWIRWKSIGWESKKEDMPSMVPCINGSTIHFYSSKGAPQQGNEIHRWWCDEELEHKDWVSELNRGLATTGGSGMYSATPLAASDDLFEMHRMSKQPEFAGEVEEYRLLIKDNYYIRDENKQIFYNSLRTEHDRRVRWFGEFAMQGLIVYPEFNEDDHVVDQFEIPINWTRYMVVDPGVHVCAVLFIAVPPPEETDGNRHPHDGEVHVYDELYLKKCSAAKFAKAVSEKMGDNRYRGFQEFLIDGQMARQSQMGSGRTVGSAYAEALQENKVESVGTGSSFRFGTPNIEAREESLRRWLEISPSSGKRTLRIHRNCVNLIWEMPKQTYIKDSKSKQPTKKRRNADNHATHCLEYIADARPRWVRPAVGHGPESAAVRYLREKREKQSRRGKVRSISLGP